MLGIRTAAVRDQQGRGVAADQIDEMEARLRRGRGEIGDRDAIPAGDVAAMLIERVQRGAQQSGTDNALGCQGRRAIGSGCGA